MMETEAYSSHFTKVL